MQPSCIATSDHRADVTVARLRVQVTLILIVRATRLETLSNSCAR